MLLAAVLLILAVLLFGSSAVIGAFGAVLGFIAFTAALAIFCSVLGVEPIIGLLIGGALLAVACAVLWAVTNYNPTSPDEAVYQARQKAFREHMALQDEQSAKGTPDIDEQG